MRFHLSSVGIHALIHRIWAVCGKWTSEADSVEFDSSMRTKIGTVPGIVSSHRPAAGFSVTCEPACLQVMLKPPASLRLELRHLQGKGAHDRPTSRTVSHKHVTTIFPFVLVKGPGEPNGVQQARSRSGPPAMQAQSVREPPHLTRRTETGLQTTRERPAARRPSKAKPKIRNR